MAITSEKQTEILKIVSGLFNAAPGGTYLTELANLVQGGMTTSQLADALAAHSLFTGTIMAGKVTTSSQVSVLMKNFGLTADSDPASAGSQAQAYFTQQINAGVGFGKIVYDAVQFLSGSVPPEFTTAATLLSNKALVAATYSEGNSSTNLTTLQTVLGSVTGTAAYTGADVTAILDAIGGGSNVGQTFTLTTGADNKTGTGGNDTFDASLSSSSMTFGPADTLDGGAGTDTLTIISNAAGTYNAASLKAIENISLTASDGATTLSLTGATGIQSVINSGSTQDVTISGLASLSTVVSVANTSATSSTTVEYASAAVAGSSDAATIKLNGLAQTTSIGKDFIKVAGVETLTVNTYTAASTIDDLQDSAMTTLKVTGDQNLTVSRSLDVSNTALRTIDASGLTGGITITTDYSAAISVTGGSGNDSITMTGSSAVNDSIDAGAGNDTVTFSANLANTDTVKGGEGTDVLAMTSALANGYTTPTTATISGFEELKITNALGAAVSAEAIQTGISTVNLAAGSGAFALTMGAGDKTVKIGAANTGSLTVNDTGTATNDTLTVTNTGSGISMFGAAAGGLIVNGYETVTINGSGTGSATTQAATVITLTPDTSGTSTLKLTGSNTFSTTGAITATAIDASGLTGSAKLTMGAAAASGLTSITGSANADTLVGDASSSIDGGAGNDTITGGAENDTISGSAGDDSITSGAGNDSITGGAGNDTIVVGASLATGDVIDGGEETDTISLTNASLTTINGYSISAITNLNNAISNVERATISDALDQTTFDMARLDSINYVTLAGWTGAETLSGLVANSTIVLNDGESTNTVANALTLSLADNSGSSDAITVKLVNDSSTNFEGVSVSGIESVTITTAEATATTTAETHTLKLTNSGITTLTLSGTESLDLSSGAVNATTVDASGIADSTAGSAPLINFLGGSANQSITGSAGADTINGGAGADTIVGGAGADSLTGGTGADSITAGEGADTIVGGSGNDTIVLTETTAAIDVVKLTWSEGIYIDTISGFTKGSSGDNISLDYAALNAASASGGIFSGAVNLANGAGTNIAGAAASTVAVLTGATTLTTQTVFVLSGATFTSTGDVEDAIESGGAFELTGSNTAFDTTNKAYILVYTDGTNAHIAAARAVTQTNDNTVFETGDTKVVDLAIITGVTTIDSSTFAAANFNFI